MSSLISGMFKINERYSYSVVSFLLILFEIIQINRGLWGGDFWEHAAVVNELSRHPFYPTHPILNVSVPHAFFSPYTLLVGLFSKITHIDAVESLKYFAILNLVLFLFSFYFFCRRLFEEHYQSIASLSLLFILLFWGSSPFLWSGFYHIFVLQYVLPYPSSFALSLSFLTLGILSKNKPGFTKQTLLCVLLMAVTFISHPYTGLFLIITCVALTFFFYNSSYKEFLISLALVILPSIILCFLWPYYNFLALFTGNNKEFHEISSALYDRIIGINWPVIFALPVLLLMEKNKVRDFLLLSIGLLLLVYGLGFVLGFSGVSRTISCIMLFAQITIAYTIVYLIAQKQTIKNISSGAPGKIYLSLVLVFFLVSLYKNKKEFKKIFPFSKTSDLSYYKRYEFLNAYVLPNDLILSDALSNWYIPSYSGKVVASAHPLLFVKDNMERKQAIETFFDRKTSDSLRDKIIQKYKPAYILIDIKADSMKVFDSERLNGYGSTIYKKDDLQLIRISSTK